MNRLSEQFIASAKVFLSNNDAEKLINAIENTSPCVSIRLNPRKTPANVNNALRSVLWAEKGYYLDERPVFTLDPLLHAGAYYVQEASSMFLAQVFRQYIYNEYDEPRILDLCAAPGGKSTHIAAMLDGRGFLLSNEANRQRTKTLQENITKWGYANCAVCSCYPKEIGDIEGVFDVVVVDAPCSGEGMFRKDETAISEWSIENTIMCAERQRKILADVLPSLRTGGILIYSTCTFNPNEDERNCEYIINELGCELLPIETEASWNIVSNSIGYHFYPHRTEGEGFFLCAFRKTTEQDETPIFSPRQKKKDKRQDTAKTPDEVLHWLNGDYIFEDGIAIPTAQKDFVRLLDERLRFMQKGITLYETKGKDIIPTHALAMCTDLDKSAFPTEELDIDRAIAFLRKDNITLNSPTKGWTLLTYRGIPLGWAKNIGGRANNAYPQNWRILMQDKGLDII